MKNEDEISIRAFARMINVSHVAVMNAIKSGKIREGVSESGKIIPSIALQEAADNSVGYANNVQQKYLDTTISAKSKKVDVPTKSEIYRQLYAFGVDVKTALLNVPLIIPNHIISNAADPHSLRQLLLKTFIDELNKTLNYDTRNH